MKRVGMFGSVRKAMAWLLSAALVFTACPMTTEAHEMETETEFEGSVEEAVEEISLFDVNGNVTVESPVVGENGEVTFNYFAPDATSVNLAGEMNGWDKTATSMSLDEGTGVWSVTVEIKANSCEYKFVVDGENWVTDPANNSYSNGNSIVYLNGAEQDVVEYTYSIYYLDADHNTTDAASLWIWTDGVDGTQFYFNEAVELGDNNTWLKADVKVPYESINIIPRAHDDWSWQDATRNFVNEDKAESVNLYLVKGEESLTTTLPGGSEDSEKDEAPEKIEYQYNIFYLDDEHQVAEEASLWIWTDGVNGSEYFFDEAVELEDGNTWLKASVKLSFDSLNIIPRCRGEWSWQDCDKKYVNADKNKEVNVYLKKGDSKAYISLEGKTEDDVLRSPVVKGNKVTFNFYMPSADTVSLAGEMNGWNKEADFMTLDKATGVWTITKTLDDEKYEYKFVVNGNDWYTDPLNDNYSNGNSVVYLEKKEVVETAYQYTIYYLDEMHDNTDAASLWIWQDGANGKQFFFDEAVLLEDGNTWLKAVVGLDYEGLNIIPRAYADWAWQDVDKKFVNEDQEKEVTIYLVNADTKVYTELPDIVKKEKRYVLIEYTRPAADYKGWNIYSWNTGYGNEVSVDFKEVAGKMVAFVPVVATKDSISFCMRRSDGADVWAEKDGGDHTVQIPLDQTIVKARFVQGEGVVGNLPYNFGYKADVQNGKVSFFYRNDALYADYDEASLEGKVKLVLDGEEYDMTYDAENERYTYDAKLTVGDHAYAYIVDGELVLDKYNENTTVVDDVEYSLFTYAKFDAEVNATITPAVIDYNDNAVINITVDSEDVVVTEAYADLTALGFGKDFAIDPALMAGTVAVKESVAAGVKTIPVRVMDQYGNIYETEVEVEVVSRDKSNDFDWDEAVIYFAVTDRFFDGNSSNNDAYGTGSYEPTMGSMYHGGDFAGLEAKLDYLKSLGVNTVWITPIVENVDDVMECGGYDGQLSAGYHGYWAKSFTELNKHLGTEEEFASLINAMHARGMKLMVDVVLNHAGYGAETDFNNTFLEGKNMLRDSSTTIAGDDKRDGLAGLPDFVTEDPEVRSLLVEWQTSWISNYDIDYYRVDTVKHVDDTTWKAFKNALTLVNPDFKMIGEYAGAGYATNANQLRTGQMDAILDFDFNDTAISFVTGDLSNVENFMEGRNNGIDNTATVGSFLGSHDEDGLMYRLIAERGYSKEDAYKLMKVAATLQMTAKGQPIIYYGEELGQTGANNWPYQDNRYDMNWKLVNEENDMLAHYKMLIAIRNANTELFAKGTRNSVMCDNSEGVIVVKRAYNADELFVGFNTNTDEAKTVNFSVKADTKYVDLYSGTTYKSLSDGTVTVEIPAAANGGTVVLQESGKSNAEELVKAQEELKAAQAAVEAAKKDVEAAKKAKATADAHLKAANKELSVNQSKLVAFEAAAKSLEKQIKVAEAVAKQAKTAADKAPFFLKAIMNVAAKTAQNIVDNLKLNLTNVKKNIEITKKDIEHSKKYVADSKSEVEAADKALAVAQERLINSEAKVEELEELIKSLED